MGGTLHFQCRGAGSVSGQGTKTPHATQSPSKKSLINKRIHPGLLPTIPLELANAIEGSLMLLICNNNSDEKNS